MSQKTVLVLHRKSASRPEVKAAVDHIKQRGIKLRVCVAWNKRDKRRIVREVLKDP